MRNSTENQSITKWMVTIRIHAWKKYCFSLLLNSRIMMNKLLYLVGVAICLVSCHSTVYKQLDKVEAILGSKPDSALKVLYAIDVGDLHTPRLQARHALLTSIALDKNYIDIADDSIISRAVNYYSQKGSREEKVKAWYYQGLVQKNAGDYTASVVSLEMAEIEAWDINDYHMLGLIYRNKSDIFRITNNNEAAIECIKKSIDAFNSNGESVYALYAKYTLAVYYLNNKELQQSHSLIRELLQTSDMNDLLRTQLNLCLARVFVEEGDSLEKAVSIFRQTPRRLFHIIDYGLYAIALHDTGQKDSSRYWIEKGYKSFDNREMTATLEYLQSSIAFKDKHYQQAYQLIDSALQVQDSLTRVLLQQSLSNAQRDYYRAQMYLQEGRVKRQRIGIIYGSCIFTLALIVLLLIVRHKKQKADSIIKEQMAQLSVARNNTIQASAYLVGALVKEKMVRLYHLSEDYYLEEDPKKKDIALSQFKQALREMRNDNSFFEGLEADLNRYCNGIMTKLTTQVPQIKGGNRRLISLLFAGLPIEWIQVLGFKNSIGSLKTTRSRLRDTIKTAHPEDEKLFLEMLETKRGSHNKISG